MENKFLKFLKLDGLLDSVKGYIDTRIQMVKLEVQEKAANVITSAIFVILLIFCGLMTMAFLSIALGNFLNELLGNTYLGYLVLGIFYLIMVILLARNITKGYFHRKVQGSIKAAIIKKKK